MTKVTISETPSNNAHIDKGTGETKVIDPLVKVVVTMFPNNAHIDKGTGETKVIDPLVKVVVTMFPSVSDSQEGSSDGA